MGNPGVANQFGYLYVLRTIRIALTFVMYRRPNMNLLRFRI